MKNIARNLFTLLVIILFVGCESNEEWTPGPQVSPDNPGVFFDSSNPTNIPIGVDRNGDLKEDHVTITLGRDEFKAASELVVPITVRYQAPNLKVAESVRFEAGATTAELKINIETPQEGTTIFPVSLEIDENYGNPYKSYGDGEIGGSTKIDLSLNMISLLGVATFTLEGTSGSNPPNFLPWEQEIYDNHDGTYTIPNFMLNNREPALEFVFSINPDNNYIIPLNKFWHVDGSDSSARWYFYTGEEDTAEFRVEAYPPYAPGDEDYLRYFYFYTSDTTSYFGFWMDVDNKEGEMRGYSRYNKASSGRFTIKFRWD